MSVIELLLKIKTFLLVNKLKPVMKTRLLIITMLFNLVANSTSRADDTDDQNPNIIVTLNQTTVDLPTVPASDTVGMQIDARSLNSNYPGDRFIYIHLRFSFYLGVWDGAAVSRGDLIGFRTRYTRRVTARVAFVPGSVATVHVNYPRMVNNIRSFMNLTGYDLVGMQILLRPGVDYTVGDSTRRVNLLERNMFQDYPFDAPISEARQPLVQISEDVTTTGAPAVNIRISRRPGDSMQSIYSDGSAFYVGIRYTVSYRDNNRRIVNYSFPQLHRVFMPSLGESQSTFVEIPAPNEQVSRWIGSGDLTYVSSIQRLMSTSEIAAFNPANPQNSTFTDGPDQPDRNANDNSQRDFRSVSGTGAGAARRLNAAFDDGGNNAFGEPTASMNEDDRTPGMFDGYGYLDGHGSRYLKSKMKAIDKKTTSINIDAGSLGKLDCDAFQTTQFHTLNSEVYRKKRLRDFVYEIIPSDKVAHYDVRVIRGGSQTLLIPRVFLYECFYSFDDR